MNIKFINFITIILLSINILIHANDDFKPYWPEGFDGTENFPEHHRLVNETSKAKVVDVYIPANSAEKPHTHMVNSYMFIDQPTKVAVRLVDDVGNEKLVFENNEETNPPFETQVHHISPEPFHYVTNTDKIDFRAIRVEIKEGQTHPGTYIDWNTTDNCKELIANTVWKMEIVHGNTNLCLKDEDLILVGNVNSQFYVIEQDAKSIAYDKLLSPIKYSEERPPVWYLQSRKKYTISGPYLDNSVFILPLRT